MLTLLIAQSALSQKVSFDEAAMPLSRLLPALGQAARVSIVAAPNVGNDVVLLRAKEQHLGEILRRIAAEDGAEVETTKTGYRIVRTAASERKERTAALAGRIAALQPALTATKTSLQQSADAATYRSLLPAMKAASEKNRGAAWGHSALGTVQVRTPHSRAAMRAALLIPKETLADLDEGDRIVYSNRPTRLQKSMPSLEGVLKSFATEYDAWSKVAAGADVQPGDYADDPFRHATARTLAPSRAVLVVSRTNSAYAAYFRLYVLDAQGRDMANASYGLIDEKTQGAMDEFQKPTDDAGVPTSSETKALIEGTPRFDGSGPETASPEAIALLAQPEKHDPLGFGATDLVRDLAGERPIVAVLPDSAWFMGLIRPGGLKRADRLVLASIVEAHDDEGWLAVRPRTPEQARRTRVDRSALGKFVRAMVATKRVPLDAYAEYAWKASDAPTDILGVPIAMMISRGTFNPDVEWRALRLFGSLSPSDRKTMVAGGGKDWTTLSPGQRALAAWIVERNIRSVSHSGPPPTSMALLSEPTEIFADGYEGLEVRLAVKDDAPLFCDSTTNPKARQWRRILEPSAAGYTSALKDGPGFDRFGVAQRTTYKLSVKARQGIQSGADLEDVVPPRDGLKPLSELPGDLRKAVEEGRARAENGDLTGGTRSSPSEPLR